jgi:hypothetical protein
MASTGVRLERRGTLIFCTNFAAKGTRQSTMMRLYFLGRRVLVEIGALVEVLDAGSAGLQLFAELGAQRRLPRQR